MRIGLLIYGSLENLSGGYIYDRNLVRYLEDRGETVEVVAIPRRNYCRCLLDNLSSGLFNRLRRLSVDVLLQDELNHPSLFRLNYRLKPVVDYPILSMVHHLRSSEARPVPWNRFYRSIERRYLESVNGFIFNSGATRAAVEGLIGKDRPSVVAYPGGDRLGNGLSPSQISDRAGRAGPLRIIFVGNLIRRKGLHVLIDALSRMTCGDWLLTVVGDPTAEPAYVRFVRRKIGRGGLAEWVELTGPLSDGELASRLSESHVLVVPSSYEGFGIVYLEGMAFGLPAVASDTGGAGEIVRHGVDGFLAPAGDAAELARCLDELCRDRGRVEAMGLAARDRYDRFPTWEDGAGKIYHFLKENTGR